MSNNADTETDTQWAGRPWSRTASSDPVDPGRHQTRDPPDSDPGRRRAAYRRCTVASTGSAPTPLVALRDLAVRVAAQAVHVRNSVELIGLPSFKVVEANGRSPAR